MTPQQVQETMRRTGLPAEQVVDGVQRISNDIDIEYTNPAQARADVRALHTRIAVLEYHYWKLDTMKPADFALRYYRQCWITWRRQVVLKLVQWFERSITVNYCE